MTGLYLWQFDTLIATENGWETGTPEYVILPYSTFNEYFSELYKDYDNDTVLQRSRNALMDFEIKNNIYHTERPCEYNEVDLIIHRASLYGKPLFELNEEMLYNCVKTKTFIPKQFEIGRKELDKYMLMKGINYGY